MKFDRTFKDYYAQSSHVVAALTGIAPQLHCKRRRSGANLVFLAKIF